MNGRIQEFMLEAGRTIPGDKYIDADFCDKFAEMIVRECCSKLENDGMVEVAMEMKQHFGMVKQ